MIVNLDNYRHASSTETQRIAVEAKRNEDRLRVFTERRRRRVEGLQRVASEVIRDRLRGRTQSEIEAALSRSYNVLCGGGRISAAIYHSIGEEI